MAIALLANTITTGAKLAVLISIFGPISDAHFNPAVTTVFALAREASVPVALAYVIVQIAGAIGGVFTAHAMFAIPILETKTKLRAGLPQGFSEFVATFGLILTIMGALRFKASPNAIAVHPSL